MNTVVPELFNALRKEWKPPKLITNLRTYSRLEIFDVDFEASGQTLLVSFVSLEILVLNQDLKSKKKMVKIIFDTFSFYKKLTYLIFYHHKKIFDKFFYNWSIN